MPPQSTWFQSRLFESGYTHVTLEITVHLNAPSDLVLVGLSARDLVSGEEIAIEAFSEVAPLRDTSAVAQRVSQFISSAQLLVDPFP